MCFRERTLRELPAVPAGVAGLVLTVFASACSPDYPPPPDTRIEEVAYTLHGVDFVDPYRWLEDQDRAETRAWIEAQNRYAELVVGQTPLRAALLERLRGLVDVPDVGSPRRAGEFEYFTMRRRGQDLPIIYRRLAPAAGDESTGSGGEPDSEGERRAREIDPAGDYEVVLDPHPMSLDHTTRVAIVDLSSDGRWMLYSVRDGGQDEIEIRVRDLGTGAELPDRLPEALYSSVSFTPDETGFLYSRRSRQTGARIYSHRLGTDISDDEMLFGEGYGPESFVSVQQIGDGRYRLFTVQHGWASTEVHFQDLEGGGPVRTIVEGAPARFYPRFVDGELWMRTDLDAPNNRIVAVDLEQPRREAWREVVAEADAVLEDFAVIGERIYVTYLRDVSNEIRVFDRAGTPAGEIEVPPFHSAGIRAAGEGEATLTLGTFTRPELEYRIDLETGERTLEEPADWERLDWDPSGIEVEQVWATSRDGTRVPIYLVHAQDVDVDGDNPTLLTGYGGFYAARKPGFSTTTAVWLEHGGVWALANLRGGSEFGESWHRAGMLENKQNVFDDFIAAAEWLIDNGYTNPDKLAISGASNGGLLVGAALTQRPDLFRAVLCAFPDVDILRFFEFTENNNMPALLEYGNASIREQFEAIRLYSPYQNVRPDTAYPAVMVVSGDLDTRVPPLAARKFTARLQNATSSGLPIILRYHPKAGHAAGRGLPFSIRVENTAMELAFLMSQLGMDAAPR